MAHLETGKPWKQGISGLFAFVLVLFWFYSGSVIRWNNVVLCFFDVEINNLNDISSSTGHECTDLDNSQYPDKSDTCIKVSETI